ncbi:hypothetical protein F8388_027082 [Cannabis sativa]|uniref:CRC domain-containing protein n=1 Tax=Cannabis sativa TaxID=3483 RepID=A0A7J6FRI3_CANSA|nr:hypothetical protein F8388_027082 [Cannabis sativa]KAF4387825.1 hypothetical protein G4B88_004152 [Cannabis sativa]
MDLLEEQNLPLLEEINHNFEEEEEVLISNQVVNQIPNISNNHSNDYNDELDMDLEEFVRILEETIPIDIERHSSNNHIERKMNKVKSGGCACKKRNCLTRNCNCFSFENYCGGSCVCDYCINTSKNEKIVEKERQRMKDLNPRAFGSKIMKDRKIIGCKCIKSNCITQKCSCLKMKNGCTERCRCKNCQNTFGIKQTTTKPVANGTSIGEIVSASELSKLIGSNSNFGTNPIQTLTTGSSTTISERETWLEMDGGLIGTAN